MKVVAVGTRGFPGIQGGIETHCQHLYPRLRRLGCRVIVVGRRPYTGPRVKRYQGVPVLPVPSTRGQRTEAIFHTVRGLLLARRLKADIVHIHAIGPALLTPLARLLGLRVVVTHHGQDYHRAKWGRLARRVLRLGEWMGVRWADAVICVSDAIAASVRQRMGRSCVAIPNGVEIPPPPEGERTLRRFGLEAGRYVLAVGRFVHEKGFESLIAAFAGANLAGWRLALVGDGDRRDRYSERLKALARQAGAVLTGILHGPELHELYAHAGLFVLPSFHEGLPIALLEALSHGLPALASDIAPNREAPLPAECRFPPGDEAALARLLQTWAARLPEAPSCRAARVEAVRRAYDWDDIARRTLEVYRSVLPAAGPARRGGTGTKTG